MYPTLQKAVEEARLACARRGEPLVVFPMGDPDHGAYSFGPTLGVPRVDWAHCRYVLANGHLVLRLVATGEFGKFEGV